MRSPGLMAWESGVAALAANGMNDVEIVAKAATKESNFAFIVGANIEIRISVSPMMPSPRFSVNFILKKNSRHLEMSGVFIVIAFCLLDFNGCQSGTRRRESEEVGCDAVEGDDAANGQVEWSGRDRARSGSSAGGEYGSVP